MPVSDWLMEASLWPFSLGLTENEAEYANEEQTLQSGAFLFNHLESLKNTYFEKMF